MSDFRNTRLAAGGFDAAADDQTVSSRENDGPIPGKRLVEVAGSIPGQQLIESQTQADAVAGVLTFSANFGWVEIVNTDTVNDGTFQVNGITIPVQAQGANKADAFGPAEVGGTAGATVTVTGATTYIVNRYV